MSGVVVQQQYQFDCTTIFCAALASLFVLFALQKQLPNFLWYCALIIVFAWGGYSYQHSIDQFDAFFITHANIKYSVTGTIVDCQYQRGSRHSYVFTVAATQLQNKKDKYRINKNMLVYTQQCDCKVGDTITINDVTFKKPNNDEFVRYLLKQGVSATLFITAKEINCTHRPERSIRRWVHSKRKKLYWSMMRSLTRTSRALASALFFGNRSDDKRTCDKVSHYFKQWGIAHYFARSGLHLVLFVIFLQWLISLLPMNLLIKEVLLLLLVFIYFLMSWASLSFMRALTTLFVYKAHVINKRAFSSVSAIICIAFFALLYNPHYLFFLDFQLSFFLTFNVLLLMRLF